MPTFSQRITVGTNNGFASRTGGDYGGRTGQSSPGFLYNADVVSASIYDYGSWMRFTSVTIPQGASIVSASIDFRSNATTGTIPSTKLWAEAADNPTAPTSAADYTGRTLTTASTSWTPSTWTVASTYTSPDIAAVIQEVVNRAGWVSGNALQVFWDDAVTGWPGAISYIGADSLDGSSANCPIITIVYTDGLPVVRPVRGLSQAVNRAVY